MALNWRLALAALAIIPGVMVISFIFARRIRPIYRSVRKDVEVIDGRVVSVGLRLADVEPDEAALSWLRRLKQAWRKLWARLG